ncbi:hypothetical protein BI291_10610 [Thalassotalea sp. PP2-459]|nr:hypothetical protein BI291_10610 [Thalassotalea sp. PP2-459]
MSAVTHAELNSNKKDRILIVLTSHSTLGDSDKKTGFWLPELTHPYYEFKKAGFIVDIASIEGGMAPLDAKALDEPDEYHQHFFKDAELMAKVITTTPLSEIEPNDYNAVFYSGGSGPMWDFVDNKDINRISSAIYENNGIVSAVCHGTAALVNITLSDGTFLVKDKEIAAFTKEEEIDINQLDLIPFLLGDKLEQRGAIHIPGKAWQENVVLAGRVMTGQNPASAKKLAQEIIKYLKTN